MLAVNNNSDLRLWGDSLVLSIASFVVIEFAHLAKQARGSKRRWAENWTEIEMRKKTHASAAQEARQVDYCI